MHTAESLLQQLDLWRHFPNYQLERRADIFFALYLPMVLKNVLNADVHQTLLPEFPVKSEGSTDHRSKKVDYLAVSKDLGSAYLIELKTDMGSHNADQLAYLKFAQSQGMARLMRDLLDIATYAKDKRKKYAYLLRAAGQLGLLTLPTDFERRAMQQSNREYAKPFQAVQVPTALPQRLIRVFVQPTISDKGAQPKEDETTKVVTFAQFSEALRHGEELGQTDPIAVAFADVLKEWGSVAAGDMEWSKRERS